MRSFLTNGQSATQVLHRVSVVERRRGKPPLLRVEIKNRVAPSAVTAEIHGVTEIERSRGFITSGRKETMSPQPQRSSSQADGGFSSFYPMGVVQYWGGLSYHTLLRRHVALD